MPSPSLGWGAVASAGALGLAGAAWYYMTRRPARAQASGEHPAAVLAAIGTATPSFSGDNAAFREVVQNMGYSEDTLNLVDKIVERAGIESRHTCVADTAEGFVTAMKEGGRARALAWERGAPAMAVRAAREALHSWTQGSAADITHVVVHSCTGFAAPGIDFHLITELGLASSTRKIPVHFAGCFGGFSTLYVAKQIVEADPSGRSVVLVACAETCTAHMSTDARPELVVGNTIFADGAGAAIVCAAGFVGSKGGGVASGPAPHPPVPAGGISCTSAASPAGAGVPLGGADWQWALGQMSSEILPASMEAMTWRNSAEPGRFDMWLSKDIPKALTAAFVSQGISFARRVGIANPFTCGWAIHPGGAAILKAFRLAFDAMLISGNGLEHSQEVLRKNGNMSSATIFFVLQRVLAMTEAEEVFTAGFGPGLTIEFARLYRIQGAKDAARLEVPAGSTSEEEVASVASSASM